MPTAHVNTFKIPISILVVVVNTAQDVLLIRRTMQTNQSTQIQSTQIQSTQIQSTKSTKSIQALDAAIEQSVQQHKGFWQSVTGSIDALDEPLLTAAQREVAEELGVAPLQYTVQPIHAFSHNTALNTSLNTPFIPMWCDLQKTVEYPIYQQWRHRYAPNVYSNQEHWFALMLDQQQPITLNPAEHTDHQWLHWQAAAQQCFSESNAAAIAYVANILGFCAKAT